MISRQTNSDPANLIIIAVPALIVGYLGYRLFGIPFIVENGSLLLSAVLLILVLRIKQSWPAAFLLAQVPFQGILVVQFGLIANLMSLAAIVAFFSTQSPRQLGTVLLGTTTQKLATLAILGISVSMLWGNYEFGVIISLFQKITLLLIVATVAHGLKSGANVIGLAWVAVVSAALLFALSETEFYFGHIPFVSEEGTGLLYMVEQGHDPSTFNARLSGIGGGAGTNRLAFYGILVICLSMGLFLVHRKGWGRMLASAALIILGFGVLIAGSRSAALGLAASFLVIFLLLSHGKRFLTMGSIAIILLIAFLWIPRVLPTGDTAFKRFFSDPSEGGYYYSPGARVDQGRLDVWQLGLTLFRENPITGIGMGRFRQEVAVRLPKSRATTTHNAPISLLSETGLIGTIPFMALLIFVIYKLARRSRNLPYDLNVWQVIFLAAFLGMIVRLPFSDYHFERFFWIPIAFAAMLELGVKARQKARMSLPDQDKPGSEPQALVGPGEPYVGQRRQ